MSTLRAFCGGKSFKKDKGYAWVVLALSVISHSLHIGFGLAIVGNMTIAHKLLFDINVEQSGLISAVNVAATFLFGPVASLLVNKFGCRITAIFGGTCLVLGLGLSSLSTQPWHAFLLFGLLTGIGIPSLLVSTSEILFMHFSKYKYLAFSLAILGQFIGSAVWPVVCQLLLDSYGYSKAMLILASFQVINIVIGSLLVEPSTAVSESYDAEKGSKTSQGGQNTEGHDNPAMTVSESQMDLECEKKLDANTELEDEPSDVKVNDDAPANSSPLASFKILLKSFPVWMLLLNSLCWGGNVNSFFVFVNDFIIHKLGVTEDEAALGVTIIGITNICGTLAVVTTSSLKFDRALLHACCVMVFGTCTIFIAFSIDRTMFYILCAVCGLSQGACIANLLALISDFCKVDHLAMLFGLALLSQGIAVVTVSPLIGYITKQVGPEYGIIVSGCFGIVGALCILPVVVRRACDKRHNQADNSSE